MRIPSEWGSREVHLVLTSRMVAGIRRRSEQWGLLNGGRFALREGEGELTVLLFSCGTAVGPPTRVGVFRVRLCEPFSAIDHLWWHPEQGRELDLWRAIELLIGRAEVGSREPPSGGEQR